MAALASVVMLLTALVFASPAESAEGWLFQPGDDQRVAPQNLPLSRRPTYLNEGVTGRRAHDSQNCPPTQHFDGTKCVCPEGTEWTFGGSEIGGRCQVQ